MSFPFRNHSAVELGACRDAVRSARLHCSSQVACMWTPPRFVAVDRLGDLARDASAGEWGCHSCGSAAIDTTQAWRCLRLKCRITKCSPCFYRRISTGARLCEVQDELLTFEAQRLPPGPWKYEYCSSQPWCELDMLTTPVGDSVDLKLVSESWHVRKYGRCCTCGPGS